jgi:hypothetical protein
VPGIRLARERVTLKGVEHHDFIVIEETARKRGANEAAATAEEDSFAAQSSIHILRASRIAADGICHQGLLSDDNSRRRARRASPAPLSTPVLESRVPARIKL